MSSIDRFIERVCVQVAVLWTNQGPDGYGGDSYAAPQEILCRWQDYDQTMEDDTSVEFISHAEVLLTQDVKMNDYLYLGDLDSISSETNPMNVDKAFPVRSFRKIPMIFSTTVFVRKAFL